jgi:hypothetical protein
MKEEILAGFKNYKGFQDAFLLEDADKMALYDIEIEAEKKAFMGLGKTYNSAIREVLACPVIVLGITTMDLQWSCQTHMRLMKDDEIAGEEVWDPNKIKELEKRADVYFLHKNFVIYKGKVNFPSDVVQKRCYFEYPPLHLDKEIPDFSGKLECIACFPSTPGDIYLKNVYYEGADTKGTGTVLLGFKELD